MVLQKFPRILEKGNLISLNDKRYSAMIKERYVSPAVARLLREKGFEGQCHKAYYHDQLIDYPRLEFVSLYDETFAKAPTQQMACDFVQTKDLLITYDLAPVGTKLMVKVYKRLYDNPNYDWTEATTIIGKTLEDAFNDAIEYSLKNLI